MRTFTVRVVTKASRVKVSEENGLIKVHLTRPAQDGMANDQLIEVLADHFQVKKYQVTLTGGQHSRSKTVAISP